MYWLQGSRCNRHSLDDILVLGMQVRSHLTNLRAVLLISRIMLSLNMGSAVSAKGFGNTPICTKQHLISVQRFPRISHGRTTCKLWRGDNFILISYYGRTWTIRKELLTFDLFCRLFLYYFLCRNLVAGTTLALPGCFPVCTLISNLH